MEFVEIWKYVSLRLILKDKGGNRKIEGLTEKEGRVVEVVLPGKGQMNFIQDSCQRFPFKSNFH